MHIAIIGAGISGLLSALELAEQGCHVSIFDQQHPGQAASWAGGGILSPMYPWRYPKPVNQLARFGKALYQQWNTRLIDQTGIDFEIHDTGMLIFDQADFEQGLTFEAQHQDPMQHCDLLDAQTLAQCNPRVSSAFQQAMHFPHLSNIRNPRLLKSILRYLAQHPRVKLYPDHAIQQFHSQQQKITSISDAKGNIFKADHFVICTGAWSAMWSSQLHLDIPVHPVHGQMLLFKTPAQWLPTMCMNQVMYLIPRRDGHIVCGSSMQDRGFDHQPVAQTHQDILAASLAMVPDLAQFPIVNQWAGLRPASPDGIPYIGQMPEHENLWANFGHYRNGLCMGPASAQLLRQLMLKQTPLLDADAFITQRLSPSIAQVG